MFNKSSGWAYVVVWVGGLGGLGNCLFFCGPNRPFVAQYMIFFTPSSPKGGQRVLDAQSVLVQKHPLAGPLITVQLSGENKNLWLTGFLTALT
jgi:hypothetical protein